MRDLDKEWLERDPEAKARWEAARLDYERRQMKAASEFQAQMANHPPVTKQRPWLHQGHSLNLTGVVHHAYLHSANSRSAVELMMWEGDEVNGPQLQLRIDGVPYKCVPIDSPSVDPDYWKTYWRDTFAQLKYVLSHGDVETASELVGRAVDTIGGSDVDNRG